VDLSWHGKASVTNLPDGDFVATNGMSGGIPPAFWMADSKSPSMKFRISPKLAGTPLLLALLATAKAQVTGLRQHQAIPLSVGSGEVVSFSPTQDTLAVTDNSAGGIRLFRHDGSAFSNHATVDIAAWFTANPVAGFVYSDVTGVALDRAGSGIGVAAALNGSTVTVDVTKVVEGVPTVTPTPFTTSVPQQGRLVFFNLETGAVIGSLPAGYHPDMVAIHGGKVAVANEAQHAWDGAGVNIADFDAYQQPGSVSVVDFSGLDSSSLAAALGTLAVNTIDFSAVPALIAGLRDHTSFEPANTRPKHFHIEPEYLAFSPDNSKLFVTLQENNAIATLDLATLAWESVTPLGQRDLTIDASDNDDLFDVTNAAKGLPMPDALATWSAGGSTYVITADEGDARVDDGDIQRFAAAVTTFGLADGFTPSVANNDFGRLNVLKDQILNGPVDPASDIDKIVGLGSRGLSLWKREADNSLGFVAHLPLETELFNRDPQRHNANDGGLKTAFDARSDDKGPEPEAVAVTTLADGTVIAVAGMERQNGVVVVDITDPASPRVVRYINDSDKGLISPETVTIIDAAQSPTGTVLAVVGYEGIIDGGVAGGVGVYEINPATFRLQVLHASDMEADSSSVTAAPRFAALVDKIEDLPGNNASITVGAGDSFIPGAFLSAGNDVSTRESLKTSLGFTFNFNATVPFLPDGTTANPSFRGTDLRENPGRPDIAIMNAIGFDASAIGNHEFDLGTSEFANIVLPLPQASRATLRHYGPAFPMLSANLDFSADPALAARFTGAIRNTGAFAPHPVENFPGLHAAPTNAKLAKSAIIERGGEKIGLLGVTPPDLASISSPGLVSVTGPTGAVVVSPRTYDIDALAAHLQPTVDALVAAGCNKIVMATQLQQIDNEKLLATKLRHVDIIVAGGSGTIFSNSGILQPGDVAAGAYPFTATDLDGKTVAIVSGEGQYQYLGRLVVEFDAAGDIAAIDPSSDNIAVTAAAVGANWGTGDPYAAGTRGGTVKAVADAIDAVINAKDGLILGRSSVYLEGRRTNVRQQETNFGNLSADANLWYARQFDRTVEVAIKNGGGIRNSIGSVDVNGTPQTTAPNPSAGKQAGDISRLDIEDSLKFNNSLTALTATVEQLKVLLEHGVQGSNGVGAERSTPGQFCQLGGLMVVADLARTPVSYTSTANVISSVNGGDRIRYAALLDEAGEVTEVLIANGRILNPGRPVRLVTLNFLANPGTAGSDFGGDSYPLPWVVRTNPSANRVDLGVDATANQATFAPPGSEQDAFAEFLQAFHATNPYGGADRSVDLDRRIIQGPFDSDGDGFSNGFEVAVLGLDPDHANNENEVVDSLVDTVPLTIHRQSTEGIRQAARSAGRADVLANPAAFSLYTASSIQDLRGTGNLLIQADGASVTLALPLEKSTALGGWEEFEDLQLTFPKIADKEFYRVILPD
jgi:2',3'-cyclic-nucleotide 2'-phosphodiesterase (5'-nucleotidase family)